ncbi:MAG: PQQ-dependent sugar dehydrogenase [Phycisphaerae bacterium]
MTRIASSLRPRRLTQLPTFAATACATAFTAFAQVTPGELEYQLQPVATGLTAPIGVRHANDGSGRLFILTQRGQIRIVDAAGVLLPTPYADIAAELPVLNNGFDERGLIGLAFHPDYANNGRFFVRYSKPRAGAAGQPCFGTSRGCHEEVLAEYSVSANPDIANPAGTILIRVDKPQFNHNGGEVHFGPDGYLYCSIGDGGGAHDGLADNPPSHGPIGNGQNIQTIMGKILRLDVDSGAPYTSPPDNPFVGIDGLDEIYAYGLRNPYRFAFDDGPGGTGQLVCADVGQAVYEEINLITRGGNYGWVFREAFHCFNPLNPTVEPPSCPSVGHLGEPLINPIAEYSHAVGISITGGYVYRGALYPELRGKYVFGDWSTGFATPNGQLFYLDLNNVSSGIKSFRVAAPLGRYVLGFGVGEDNEIYVCTTTTAGPTGTSGQVARLTLICRGDVNGDRSTDLTDLATQLASFGTGSGATRAMGDLDLDGDVDLSDLALLLSQFGTTC